MGRGRQKLQLQKVIVRGGVRRPQCAAGAGVLRPIVAPARIVIPDSNGVHEKTTCERDGI
jgi:hypothetical protein